MPFRFLKSKLYLLARTILQIEFLAHQQKMDLFFGIYMYIYDEDERELLLGYAYLVRHYAHLQNHS